MEYVYEILSNCEGGSVYVDNQRVGVISGGSFTYKTTESEISIQIQGGLPANTDEVTGDSTVLLGSTEEVTVDVDTYSGKTDTDGIWTIYVRFSGNTSEAVRVVKNYKTVRNHRRTTYSNKPKATIGPGEHRIDYNQSVSTYTEDINTYNETSYLSSNSIDMSVNESSFSASGFTIYKVLETATTRNSLPHYMSFALVKNQSQSSFPVTYKLSANVSVNASNGWTVSKNYNPTGSINN